jgi:hypothetical protein
MCEVSGLISFWEANEIEPQERQKQIDTAIMEAKKAARRSPSVCRGGPLSAITALARQFFT